jgi:hypothetical protein
VSMWFRELPRKVSIDKNSGAHYCFYRWSQVIVSVHSFDVTVRNIAHCVDELNTQNKCK